MCLTTIGTWSARSGLITRRREVPVDVRVLGACVWIDVRVLAVLDLRNAKKSIRRTLPECSRLVQDGVFTPIIVVCLMFKKNTYL